MDTIIEVWDSHKLQPYRNANAPTGRPVIMYSIPEKYGNRDYAVGFDGEIQGTMHLQRPPPMQRCNLQHVLYPDERV